MIATCWSTLDFGFTFTVSNRTLFEPGIGCIRLGAAKSSMYHRSDTRTPTCLPFGGHASVSWRSVYICFLPTILYVRGRIGETVYRGRIGNASGRLRVLHIGIYSCLRNVRSPAQEFSPLIFFALEAIGAVQKVGPGATVSPTTLSRVATLRVAPCALCGGLPRQTIRTPGVPMHEAGN
ncbi:hypothetical protein PHLGIDRAFT_353468 [Phlebiopsis gigantea 11061_1 CR5-6]|uniref:Uncharacterized protein n=1 Tax=Phlebiopsis gigantea (strain 11061_1 CR5-6) TaxID=745531 RepID=A0A0C3NUC4_PHLG1|nr:hypothetical protein PHLGIDRAFT_353468 [Phlebiopsis gigantea 11061_1 CR5-6]